MTKQSNLQMVGRVAPPDICDVRPRGMMNETDITRRFRDVAREFFARYPSLNPRWPTNSKWADLELEIPPQDDSGFSVSASIRGEEIVVFGAGSHQHLTLQKDAERLVSEAFGLIYDLLSPGMRVIECTAGGKPYRWYMQTEVDGEWRTDIMTALFVWRFLSKKEQRILQNKAVPLRERMVEQSAAPLPPAPQPGPSEGAH